MRAEDDRHNLEFGNTGYSQAYIHFNVQWGCDCVVTTPKCVRSTAFNWEFVLTSLFLFPTGGCEHVLLYNAHTHRKGAPYAPCNANQSGVIQKNERKLLQRTDGKTWAHEDDIFAILAHVRLVVRGDKRMTRPESTRKNRNVKGDMAFFIWNRLTGSAEWTIGHAQCTDIDRIWCCRVDVVSSVRHSLWHFWLDHRV